MAAVVVAMGVEAATGSARADDTPLELGTTAPPSAPRVVAFAAGGLGLAGIAGGAVFGLMASASWNSAKTACPDAQHCTSANHSAAVADHDSAELWATTSTIAFASGGALVATAIVLLLTAPAEQPARPAATPTFLVAPSIGSGGAGVVIAGSF